MSLFQTNSQKEISLVKKGVLKYNGIEQAESIMNKNYDQAINLLQTFGENNYKKVRIITKKVSNFRKYAVFFFKTPHIS